jgi:hypothetical protein
MAPNPFRADMVAELAELRRLQLKSISDATYIGWTHEQMVAQQKRSNRIAVLQRELDAIDGTSRWGYSLWS